MSINMMQGALAAVILQQRKVTGNKLAAGAALAAVMPGVPGLLVPVLMTQNSATNKGGPGTSAGSVTVVTTGPTTFVRVPHVEGMQAEAAKQAIEEANLEPEIVLDHNHRTSAQDVVYTQTPTANAYVEEQSTVELLVRAPEHVPSVTGLGLEKALETLKKVGLEARELYVDFGGKHHPDTVVVQNPKPGRSAGDGKVTLLVQRPEASAAPGGAITAA
jgi:beta-lactam-binding protein with PASTA domain